MLLWGPFSYKTITCANARYFGITLVGFWTIKELGAPNYTMRMQCLLQYNLGTKLKYRYIERSV